MILNIQILVKKKTHKYPLAPYKTIDKNELSDCQLQLLEKEDKNLGTNKKLLLDLKSKEKDVLNSDILKYYISQGMKVTKVHRIISFNHSNVLNPYVNFCQEQRKKAKTKFEDLWKTMVYSFFGKTIENI